MYPNGFVIRTIHIMLAIKTQNNERYYTEMTEGYKKTFIYSIIFLPNNVHEYLIKCFCMILTLKHLFELA